MDSVPPDPDAGSARSNGALHHLSRMCHELRRVNACVCMENVGANASIVDCFGDRQRPLQGALPTPPRALHLSSIISRGVIRPRPCLRMRDGLWAHDGLQRFTGARCVRVHGSRVHSRVHGVSRVQSVSQVHGVSRVHCVSQVHGVLRARDALRAHSVFKYAISV